MTQENKPLTLAAGGDAMITTKLMAFDHPRFHRLRELIDDADAGFINLEVLLHDYDAYPAANGPGTYMRAPPSVADDLTEMGFDLFAAATNHVMDYTHGGMERTMEALEERNISYAGLGRNLSEARAPAYCETAAGRVALVGACSTITTGSEAGKQRENIGGRPGLSPLRHDTRYRVPDDTYEALLAASKGLGLEDYKRWRESLGFPLTDSNEDHFQFINLGGDTHLEIEPADEFEVQRVPNKEDVDAILREIRRANRQADLVIASLHYHEGDGARSTDKTVAPFVESFARESIEAGADMFVGHGSHTLRGIEIYDGAPIFYSLGNFVAQNELIDRLPPEVYDRYGFDDDATPADVYDWRTTDDDGDPAGFHADRGYYETVLPLCEFEKGNCSSITLYPVDLMLEEPRPKRGRPIIAGSDVAESIFERLRRLSEPYGTEITVESGQGEVDLV